MFIRATTITADPSRVDELISFATDEVAPVCDRLRGSLGLSMFVDRKTGTCTISTAWQTEEDRDASDEALRPLRARAAELMGATPAVELLEMVVLDRRRPARPGFWSRMTRVSIDPGHLDDAIDAYGATTLPALELLDGFCSAALLVDRTKGSGVSTVVFDSKAALEASRLAADEIRRTSAAKAGAQIVDVRESEIVLAGIRAPETG